MNGKIIFHRQKTILFVLFFVGAPTTYSQDSVNYKYELHIIKNAKEYNSSIENMPDKKMVDLKRLMPQLILDLRYATNNNFMHKKLYTHSTSTYLRQKAAFALKQIENELQQKVFGLKIFDAYRPYSITKKMWELIRDTRYVADPKKGSGHNRGIAVDLTIINLKTGKELNMGTGFDNFTDSAHHDFKNLSEEILLNRSLLKNIMEKYGFKSLQTEWWHYSLSNANDFELLDISFKKLKNLN